MRLLTILALLGAALILSLPAAAVPGSLAWLKDGGSSETTQVSAGSTASIQFTAADATGASKVLRVNSDVAQICFIPDTGGVAGLARISFFRAVGTSLLDTAAIALPSITFDGTDCDSIVAGTYWFEIGTAADGVTNAIVTITGG